MNQKEKGQRLVDEYGYIHDLDEELARGGQGVVCRTKDPDLAIKLPNNKTSDLKKSFQRIRTLPLPPRIPISLPLSILRDEPGYVMRLLNGMAPFSRFSADGKQRTDLKEENLPEWLAGIHDKKIAAELVYYAKTGSTRRRLYALYKAAAILARLHSAGLVYGDISESNCFVGENIPCECWLIDADNVRFERPKGGGTVYTPQLGAPEIVQGKDSSRPRTDCWAFAVMAFQMLARCHPFIGKKVLEDGGGWDAEPVADGAPADLDEQAYAGFLPFIDDDDDDSNALPNDGLPRQLVFTPQLNRLFQETFGIGRTQPHRRPAMAFWALELARAFDNSLVCPSCKMSYFNMAGFKKCPYCQMHCPAFVIAKTPRWQMILLENGEQPLPHRMFHSFSFEHGDDTAFEAVMDLKTKAVKPVRGTQPFPPELSFEFVETRK